MVFVVLEVLPGDAALIMMGPDAAPEAVRALAAKLGLDQPALQQVPVDVRVEIHTTGEAPPRLGFDLTLTDP